MKKFTKNENNQQFISISIKDGTDPAKVLAYISGKYPTINGNVYEMDEDEILLNLEGDVHYGFALNPLKRTIAEVAEADIYTFCVDMDEPTQRYR